MSFIILTYLVSNGGHLKFFMSKIIKPIEIQKILNGCHLETGLVRIMKLIPVFIHNKILTCVIFEFSIFNETKVTKRIVKYTYRQTHVYIVSYDCLDLSNQYTKCISVVRVHPVY
jgi:hypothetical protein